MLCRNFGEALNLLMVILAMTVGLVIITIAPYLGWFHWTWFQPCIAWGTWIVLIFLGLCRVIMSPMH